VNLYQKKAKILNFTIKALFDYLQLVKTRLSIVYLITLVRTRATTLQNKHVLLNICDGISNKTIITKAKNLCFYYRIEDGCNHAIMAE